MAKMSELAVKMLKAYREGETSYLPKIMRIPTDANEIKEVDKAHQELELLGYIQRDHSTVNISGEPRQQFKITAAGFKARSTL
jgi:hypothetical protein